MAIIRKVTVTKLNPKSIALVKLTIWAGLITWMVFFVAYSIVAAQTLSGWILILLGEGARGKILIWVAPIWVVFTALMLCWAVARFTIKKFIRKD